MTLWGHYSFHFLTHAVFHNLLVLGAALNLHLLNVEISEFSSWLQGGSFTLDVKTQQYQLLLNVECIILCE